MVSDPFFHLKLPMQLVRVATRNDHRVQLHRKAWPISASHNIIIRGRAGCFALYLVLFEALL